MAKTNRRPVDKLERQQRLAQRNRVNRQLYNLTGSIYNRLVEDLDEEERFENMDKTQAA